MKFIVLPANKGCFATAKQRCDLWGTDGEGVGRTWGRSSHWKPQGSRRGAVTSRSVIAASANPVGPAALNQALEDVTKET